MGVMRLSSIGRLKKCALMGPRMKGLFCRLLVSARGLKVWLCTAGNMWWIMWIFCFRRRFLAFSRLRT